LAEPQNLRPSKNLVAYDTDFFYRHMRTGVWDPVILALIIQKVVSYIWICWLIFQL